MHSLSLILSPPPGRHIENALYCSIVGKLNTQSLVQWCRVQANVNKMAARENVHVCDYKRCGKSFSKEIRLVEHKRMHTGEVKKMFSCFLRRSKTQCGTVIA